MRRLFRRDQPIAEWFDRCGDEVAQQISGAAHIARLLQRLRKMRTAVTLVLEQKAAPLRLEISHVDLENERVVLRGEAGQCPPRRMKSGDGAMVTAHAWGGVVRWTARIEGIGRHQGETDYQFAFPDSLSFVNQRESFRVRFCLSSRALVTIVQPDGARLEGQLRDLSSGGLRAELPPHPSLRRGACLESCTVTLCAGTQVLCGLEVRYVRVRGRSRRVVVGARFCSLSVEGRRLIERHILELQRRDLQRGLPMTDS